MVMLVLILFIAFVLILGYVLIFRDVKTLRLKLDFANLYRNTFVQFSNRYFESDFGLPKAKNVDNELYHWLTKKSVQMQADLGGLGIIEYHAPFRTHIIRNYEVIVNSLPKYRDELIQQSDVNSCDDVLLRHIGNIENKIEILEKQLKSPLTWLQKGIRALIALPIYLLLWFGIITDKSASKIIQNTIFKIITGIFALVTFISCVVTIIQGKDATIQFIQNLFGRN